MVATFIVFVLYHGATKSLENHGWMDEGWFAHAISDLHVSHSTNRLAAEALTLRERAGRQSSRETPAQGTENGSDSSDSGTNKVDPEETGDKGKK